MSIGGSYHTSCGIGEKGDRTHGLAVFTKLMAMVSSGVGRGSRAGHLTGA